jgi:hypothetical protein
MADAVKTDIHGTDHAADAGMSQIIAGDVSQQNNSSGPRSFSGTLHPDRTPQDVPPSDDFCAAPEPANENDFTAADFMEPWDHVGSRAWQFVRLEAWQAIKDRQIKFCEGASSFDNFSNTVATIEDFVGKVTREHARRADKVGAAFSCAELLSDAPAERGKGKNLTTKNVSRVHAIAFDFDSGETPEAVCAPLLASRTAHAVYSSHSNGKAAREADHDALLKHMATRGREGCGPEPSDVTAFLIGSGRVTRGLAESVCGPIECGVTEGGKSRVWRFATAPCPKFRVVLFLAEPFGLFTPGVIGDRSKVYAAAYNAIAADMGWMHDKACSNPDRLFYYPACPTTPPAQPFRWFEPGGALDFTSYVQRGEATAPKTGVRASAAKRKKRSTRPELKTPNLFRFGVTCSPMFDAEEFCRAKELEERGASNNGGTHFACPNEAGQVTGRAHTSSGGTPFRVVSAPDDAGAGFKMECLTEGCKEHFGGDRLLLLDAVCQQAGVKDAVELIEFCHDSDAARAAYDDWADFSRGDKGILTGDPANTRVALKKLGVKLRHDTNLDRLRICEGDDVEGVEGTDAIVSTLRFRIHEAFGFLPAKEMFYDAVAHFARENSFHPVRDYLAEVQAGWDGAPRLNAWVVDYMNCEDTPFNRAAGVAWMLAAVRRMRQPGTKFDELPVFESGQGLGKSTALAILAVRPEWFTDNLPLSATAKEVIESTRGVWLAEIAEMFGMKRDVDNVKAFLSRWEDRARAAYGRLTEAVPRQFVCAGTTNKAQYLRDDTGNRRFWPLTVLAPIDLGRLRSDRDQLWGEAATREAAGESCHLSAELWGEAAKVQASRAVENPFVDVLVEHFPPERTGRIKLIDLYDLLNIPVDRRAPHIVDQVADAMNKLGWGKKKPVRFHQDRVAKGFEREGANTIWHAERNPDTGRRELIELHAPDSPAGLADAALAAIGRPRRSGS